MGLDLRSSDLTRGKGFASDGSQDFMHSPQGGLKTRYGSKMIMNASIGRTGMVRFDTTSMTGVSKTEIILFGGTTTGLSVGPKRLVTNTFVLTNSHASVAATVTHFYDEATSQFRFKIVRGTTLIDQALGVGTEGSPYMLSSLETAVDALTSFAMSTPASASAVPAACMELIPATTVAANGGTLTVYYYYVEDVPTTATGPYATLENTTYEVGSESYRNTSAAIVNNVLYMSSGNNCPTTVAGGDPILSASLSKYDGQDFYLAGFKDVDINTATVSAGIETAATAITDSKGTRVTAAAIPAGYYTLKASIVRVDKAGNRIESNLIGNDASAVSPQLGLSVV